MVKGGARAGAGRKKGGKNQKSREIAERAAAAGITPLEVMIATMRDLFKKGKKVEASAIAKDAAPYMHPRLAAIEHGGAVTQEIITYASKDQRDAAIRAALGHTDP